MADGTNAHASRGKAAPSSYAIVETGGKQYRAEKGATLLVERLGDDEGAKVNLRAVMFNGGKDVVASGADLEKVKVEAVVAEHLRGPKVRIFKHRPKKGYRRRAGHRQSLTKLEVTDVKMLTRKPAKQGAGAKQQPAKPKAKAPAKKTPAKGKSTGKKPAARKASTTKKKGS